MSDFYTDFAADALALIQQGGQQITLLRLVTSYDPVAGAITDLIADGDTCFAFVSTLPATSRRYVDEALVDALIAGRLRKVLIAAQGCPFPPLPNDILQFEGSNWHVHAVANVNPANTTPVLYTLVVEKQSVVDFTIIDVDTYEAAVAHLHNVVNVVEPLAA